jgi:hypothetical protein
MSFNRSTKWLVAAVVASIVPLTWAIDLTVASTQTASSAFPPQVKFTGVEDHQNMMDQLGIKALRRGADPHNQATYDEATANNYPLLNS